MQPNAVIERFMILTPTEQPAAAVTDASDRGSKASSGRHGPYRALEKSVLALPLTQSGLSHNAGITVRACISAS
jgi:hypothetical protein